MLALVALAFAGTVGPFALFAYGQSRVAPELAGAFLNLEPLVGTAAGALAFGDPFGPTQLLGGAVILAGIALSHDPTGWCAAPESGIPHPRTQGGRLGAPAPGEQAGAMHGLLQIHVANATQADRRPSWSIGGCGSPHLKTPGTSLPPHKEKRETTYQAAPLNTLPQHDPPRPPTRPHPDPPHLCGPGGSRAPLP